VRSSNKPGSHRPTAAEWRQLANKPQDGKRFAVLSLGKLRQPGALIGRQGYAALSDPHSIAGGYMLAHMLERIHRLDPDRIKWPRLQESRASVPSQKHYPRMMNLSCPGGGMAQT
jgi:hypothetical protein